MRMIVQFLDTKLYKSQVDPLALGIPKVGPDFEQYFLSNILDPRTIGPVEGFM